MCIREFLYCKVEGLYVCLRWERGFQTLFCCSKANQTHNFFPTDKLVQSIISKNSAEMVRGISFLINLTFFRCRMEQKSTRHEAWKKLHVVSHPEICGIGAGIANIILTFPINKFTFRQQLESATITNTWNSTSNFLRNHNHVVRYVYRGCTMPLTQKSIANSLMYRNYFKKYR